MNNQPIFITRGTSRKIAIAVFIICLLGIIFSEIFNWRSVQQVTMTLGKPFYWLSNVPSNVLGWGINQTKSRNELNTKNQMLQDEVLILKARQLTFNELLAENTRLRHLLNANELVEFQVLIGEIYGIVPNYNGHRLLVNRGSNSNIFVGQPVIDDTGLFGQVIEVTPFDSQILLISDKEHAFSVSSVKNSYRTIAEGTGDFNQLKLRHVPVTVDIDIGDEFVTSGLDGTYPQGYPVGLVTHVTKVEGTGLLDVTLGISAQLQFTRNILFLFTNDTH